jgi:MoaA/NifB/PqqE/SkfB family radical SAM enzyme
VKVTTRCNLKCAHCWSKDTSSVVDINVNTLLKFIKKLKKTLGLKQVSLSGGEPTLYPYLNQLVRKLIKINLNVIITINGTSPKSILGIIKLPKNYQSKLKIRLSIDGWHDQHDSIRGNGTCRKTVDEAKQISSKFGSVGINTVVLYKPKEISKLLKDLSGVKLIDWAFITPITRGKLKSKKIKTENVFRNINLWQKNIKKTRPDLRLITWDYITHPNGGILIEADGIVKMPGIQEIDDIVIGKTKSLDLDILKQYMKRRLIKDPIAYFSLS